MCRLVPKCMTLSDLEAIVDGLAFVNVVHLFTVLFYSIIRSYSLPDVPRATQLSVMLIKQENSAKLTKPARRLQNEM